MQHRTASVTIASKSGRRSLRAGPAQAGWLHREGSEAYTPPIGRCTRRQVRGHQLTSRRSRPGIRAGLFEVQE